MNDRERYLRCIAARIESMLSSFTFSYEYDIIRLKMRMRTMPTSKSATTLPPSWCWTSSRVTWWQETAGRTERRGLLTLLTFVGWPCSLFEADPPHFLRLTQLPVWGWPCSLFEADPAHFLRLTLLTFFGWPYSQFEADPAHFFWLTLLPCWGWPYSHVKADPALHMLWTLLRSYSDPTQTLLGPYSDPTLHLLCTYSQTRSRVTSILKAFHPCPRGGIIKMHHADFPSLLIVC